MRKEERDRLMTDQLQKKKRKKMRKSVARLAQLPSATKKGKQKTRDAAIEAHYDELE